MKTGNTIRHRISLSICLSLFVAGCVQNTAKENNDLLVSLKEKADEDFDSMNRFLNMAIEEKEYSIIDYLTTTAIDSLALRIEILKQLELPPTAGNFKEATINYTQSLINVSKAYKSYAILSDSLLTVQPLDSVREMIRKAECTMDSLQVVLIGIQRDFAREKKLKL